jgi:hypothetical protein
MARQYVYFTDGIEKSWNKNCALLGYCAASSGNFLSTFQDNLSVPSSGVKNQTKKIGCPETSVINSHYSVHNNPEGRSCQLFRGGSLKSQNGSYICLFHILKLHFFKTQFSKTF